MSGAFQKNAFMNGAFQVDQGGFVPPYPGPAGGTAGRGGKRKRYVFPDGTERNLSREDLEDALGTMLGTPVDRGDDTPAPKVAAKDRQIVAAFPNYPDLRDMFIAAQQIEVAQALRQVADRLAHEQDESDVEVLLLWG